MRFILRNDPTGDYLECFDERGNLIAATGYVFDASDINQLHFAVRDLLSRI